MTGCRQEAEASSLQPLHSRDHTGSQCPLVGSPGSPLCWLEEDAQANPGPATDPSYQELPYTSISGTWGKAGVTRPVLCLPLCRLPSLHSGSPGLAITESLCVPWASHCLSLGLGFPSC